MKFENNCGLDSECISHCIKHSLSSPIDNSLNVECEKQHVKICRDCFNVINSIYMIKREIEKTSSPDKENRLQEIDDCYKDIIAWQKHLIRSRRQDEAKCYALQKIDGETSLWVRDWAQKILPGSGMEAQDVKIKI